MVERAANTLAKAEADGDNPSPAFVRAFVSKVTTTNHLNNPIPCNLCVSNSVHHVPGQRMVLRSPGSR